MGKYLSLRGVALVLAVSAAVFAGEGGNGTGKQERMEDMQKQMEEVLKRLERLEERMFEGRMPGMHRMPGRGRFETLERLQEEMEDLLEGLHGGQMTERPFLGVAPRDPVAAESREMNLQTGVGAVIEEVIEGTAAEEAGIRKGDVVTAVNGETVRGAQGLVELIGSREPGEEVTLKILRGGKEMELEIELGSMPESAMMPRRFGRQWPPMWRMPGMPGRNRPPSIPGMPEPAEEPMPKIEVKVQSGENEVVLSVQTNVLAVTGDMMEELGLSEEQRKALEQVLSGARDTFSRKLSPKLQEALSNGGVISLGSEAVNHALNETIEEVRPDLEKALGAGKADQWEKYVNMNRFVTQSMTVRRGKGRNVPSPSVPALPGGNVRSF